MKTRFCWLFLSSVAQAVPQGYNNLIHCLSSSGVPQVLPNTTLFTSTIIPFNVRLNFTPVAYTFPTTVPQVQAAVKCASSFGTKVNPKSGGHSYASHSIGGEDGHLVVDLKFMYNVTVDPKTFVATIGPAARLGNVAIALFNQSERALPFGLCPGVGIGGHALHGGQGYSTHNHGLLLDTMIEAEMVTAWGDVVCASKNENPDLFWALRGAGMNFGIVTSLKFQTFAAPNQTVLFYYPFIWSQAQATAAWDAWQVYTGGLEAPREMNARLFLSKWAPGYWLWLLEGAWHGSEADFGVAIAPLLDAFNAIGGAVTVAELPGVGLHVLGWLDAILYANNNDLLAGYGSGETLEKPLNYDVHSNFFAKSLMTSTLSLNASSAWISTLYTTGFTTPAGLGFFTLISAQGGPTSYFSTIDSDSTSYPHRASIYEWQFSAVALTDVFPEEGVSWLNSFVGGIEDGMKEKEGEAEGGYGMYYNYADPSLHRGEADHRYWMGNLGRVKALKELWDPEEVFMNPQTVESWAFREGDVL